MIKYHFNDGDNAWKITEDKFDINVLGKTESIFSLGNGYLGLRSALEESYCEKKPGLFINGTFDKFQGEVEELPNGADLTEVTILVNDKKFSMSQPNIKKYEKTLFLKTGELKRTVIWEYEPNKEVEIVFSRFVSLDNIHVFSQKISIKSLTEKVDVCIINGINSRITNSGTQHFEEMNYRIFGENELYMKSKTLQSKVYFYYLQKCKSKLNGLEDNANVNTWTERRMLKQKRTTKLEVNDVFDLELINSVMTSRDVDFKLKKEFENDLLAYQFLNDCTLEKDYETLSKESFSSWASYWKENDIIVDSENIKDQILTRFSIYHLRIMTPHHDDRLNVGAKGLSGEGYKGHSFWDTEMFVLPYFIWQNPEVAKKLLINRYRGLKGARKKALDNGFEGAMFPWETGWYCNGEQTPIMGSPDLKTGERNISWTGIIELHVTSDIAYAVNSYYQITKDIKFMQKYGFEIIFDTAKFWISRLEYISEKDHYEINDVIGPDEYKDHKNNNAFTNYMAWWLIDTAINYIKLLRSEDNKLLQKLDSKINFLSNIDEWETKLQKIYLPQLNENQIMPQDDTYLNLKNIDVANYRFKPVYSIFADYDFEEVNNSQVSKQTDVLFLFLLLEHLWDDEVKRKNFEYYEPRTIHDSSLSLSTHVILGSDIGLNELAYFLWEKSFDIDLGGSMKSSNEGIHAAAMAGISLSVLQGFCGIRNQNGKVRLNPNLPDKINAIKGHFFVDGVKCKFEITKKTISLQAEKKIKILVLGNETEVEGKVLINY